MKINEKSLEYLRLENSQLMNSKEYRIGLSIVETLQMLKGLHFLSLFQRFLVHRKVKKYDHTFPNWFAIDNTPIKNKKIVIYTCNVQGYDTITDPICVNETCDYILFTDDETIVSETWKVVKIPDSIKKNCDNNPFLINRYYKLNPHNIFTDYDYSIYVDSSFKLVSDISVFINNLSEYGFCCHIHRKHDCIYEEYEVCRTLKKGNIINLQEQIQRYKYEGFPKNYGMLECGLLVSNLKNEKCIEIMDAWWKEFSHSSSLRDQISLPYVLWRKNIAVKDIGTIGNNIFYNPKFIIRSKHNK